MSEHLKAEREKIAAAAGPATTVDLTNDQEEEDCQIVGGSSNVDYENEEICLGVILSHRAHISRLPQYSRDSQAGVGKESWPRTKLRPRRDAGSTNHKIELIDRSHHVCGTVELKLALALCQLYDGARESNIRMTFYLDTHRRKSGQLPGMSMSEWLSITVVVYSPRRKKKLIGQWLSQRQMCIRDSMVGAINEFDFVVR